MLDVSIRLRRAVRCNDVELVKRICRCHRKHIVNPDMDDKGNTSLHTAADLGYLDIAAILIDFGHERDGITRNYNLQTPLMMAAASSVKSQADNIAKLILGHFPECLEWKDKWGHTALLLASKNGNDPVLSMLLDAGAAIDATDSLGNTALHYASAYGGLKCVRTLIDRGASTEIINKHGWVAHAYSYSQPAETYFLSLIKSKGLTSGLTSAAAAAAAAAAQQERANIRMIGSMDAGQMRQAYHAHHRASDADSDAPSEALSQRYSEDQDKDGA